MGVTWLYGLTTSNNPALGPLAIVRKHLRHSVGFLIPAHLHDAAVGNFPCLTLKAYNSRVWLAYMDVCFEEIFAKSPDNVEIKLAFMAIRHLVRWHHLMETAPRRYVSAGQAAAMFDAGIRFLRVSQLLVHWAASNNLLRWKVIPKHHVL